MVRVTDADREAAASVAVLPEMRELILAGRADHHAEPFARHRIAGAKAALEKAGQTVCGLVEHHAKDGAVSHTAGVLREIISMIDPEECE